MSVPAKKKGSDQYDPVRLAAVEAMILIEQGDQAEDAIATVCAHRNFRSIDHRFLQTLVNGATKMRRRLDYEIKFYLARPSAALPLKLSNVLRLGFYQLRFADKVPEAAAVNETVNLARYLIDRTRGNLVNAVMRASLRQPDKVRYPKRDSEPTRYLGVMYSYPDHFVQYCLDEFGFDRTEALLKVYNAPPRVCYRVNYLKAKPDEVAAMLEEHGVSFHRSTNLDEFIYIDQTGLPLHEELIATGKVFVQDESAGLVARLVNPKQGMNVVDLTAAPGGKTTHMAIRMRDKGRVTAVDKSHSRLKLVEENARRLGIRIISPVAADMADFKGGPFDRVLLDPPCTGWGTAGKHADLRWAKSPADIQNLTKIQTMMIDRAARLVKPGGVLVYSTCSIIRAENDQVVEEFLLRNKQFSIDSAETFFDKSLVTERGFVKTYPDHPEMDGAFAARLILEPE